MTILDSLRRRIETIEQRRHREELEAIEAAILQMTNEERADLIRIVEAAWLAEGRELSDLHDCPPEQRAEIERKVDAWRHLHP